MGNTESSSSPSSRTPPASPSLVSAGDEEELALIIKENTEHETTSQLLLLSPFSNASSSSSPPDDKTTTANMKKKKRHSSASSSETLMANLHCEARDLAAMCFWVRAFLKRFNDNCINNSNQQEKQNTSISEDGYTPEETLHMIFFAQQQDDYQHQSNNDHSQLQEQPEKSLVESLQELQAQCHEYVQAHSQPGAPRIINARSRLRRRQRLIERPMTLLLSSSSSLSTTSASSHYGAIHETNDDNNNDGNKKEEEEELFYGIVKDDVHQRIVLVFHETPAMMRTMQSSSTSWQDLLHVHQVHVPLPSTLQGKVPRDPNSTNNNNNNNNNITTTLEFVDSIGLRADLYHFLFSNKNDCSNIDNNNSDSRYQNLLTALQHVLRAHPSYTFHVTGFYGGAAACAVMVAFFLAAEPQAVLYNHVLFTTNPIVNCLAFSCPRVGDSHFLQACQYLERGEQQKQKRALDDAEQNGGDDCRNCSSPLLRMGRIVVVQSNNDNDTSAQIPMWNFSHVGFQIRLYQNDKDFSSSSSSKAPEITYPKLVDHWTNRWSRTWANAISIPSVWKLLHQHSQDTRAAAATAAAANYRRAIQQAQGHLQEYKEGMTSLYGRDKDASNAWTGF